MTDYKQLTEAQRYQIAALLRAGQTNKKIAEIIGVSDSTVSRELTRIAGYADIVLNRLRSNRTDANNNPLAGDVIPGAEGARKVRWSIAGKGKRGGVRVIYFNLTEQGTIALITLYQKANQADIRPSDIQKAV